MRYRISAAPRQNYLGFWRSGIFFPNAPAYVELDEEEITPAIRSEKMLIIQPVLEQTGSKEGETDAPSRQLDTEPTTRTRRRSKQSG